MIFNFDTIPQNKRYGYARSSSNEQKENSSLESQKAKLMKFNVLEENIYREIAPATDKIKNRPIFSKLINEILREGDLLIITKLDRCSRSTLSFLQLENKLAKKGIAFWVLDLPRDYLESSTFNPLVSIALDKIAEFIAVRRKERQKKGIEVAKRKSKYRGRRSIITNQLVRQVLTFRSQGVSVTKISQITGVSRTTIYKILKAQLNHVKFSKPDKNMKTGSNLFKKK